MKPFERQYLPSELIKSVEKHHLWVESEGSEGEKLDLAQCVLEGVNFARLNLAHANFREAKLKEAIFISTNLRGVNFEKADLHQSKFVWADFHNANLKECNLKDADLSHARNLTCGQIQSAHITQSTYFPPAFKINWVSEHIFECIFIIQPGANLERHDFRHDDLSYVDLKGANMHKCMLAETDLRGANLDGVDFRESFFHKTMFVDANLTRANLSQTELINMTLKGANLEDANLNGTNLEHVRDLTISQILSANINDDTILPEYIKNDPELNNRKNS